jgi:hypothetical protein
MIITQTIEVPADHRLTLDVPPEVPAGKAVLSYSPLAAGGPPRGNYAHTVEEALRMAEELAALGPISEFFGVLSPETFGDGLAYQRGLRDEWDD